jgi:hypothetical protein
MDAVRCLSCGETRWSLSARSYARLLSEPCQACGGETVAERRRPGAALRAPLIERRDRRPLAGAGPTRPGLT